MSTRCADDGVEGLCKDHERGVDAKKSRSSGREESRFEDEERKNACSANEENEEVDDDDDGDDDGDGDDDDGDDDDDDDVDCVAFEIDEVAEAHEAQHRTEQAALMIASKKRREAEERDALLVQQMAKRQAMERLLAGPCSCGSARAYGRCCAVGAYHRDEMELYTPMQ